MNSVASKNGHGNVVASLKGGSASGDLRGALKAANLSIATKLAELKPPPKLELDLTELELLDIEDQESHEKDVAQAERVGEWMLSSCLPTLEYIESKLKTRKREEVLDKPAGKNENGESITFGWIYDEYPRLKDEYLFQIPNAPLTRKAAHTAVLKYRLRQNPEVKRPQLVAIENLCVDDGYFLVDSNGFIKFWGSRYALSDSEKFGGLGKDEERLLADLVSQHIKRITEDESAEIVRQIEEFGKNEEFNTLTFDEFLSGLEGTCFVHVPAHPFGSYQFPEVYIVVEGDGTGRARILEAIGADKDTALKIRDSKRKLHLKLHTLNYPCPPKFDNAVENGDLTEEDARLLQRFWWYLNAAIVSEKKKADREREQEAAIRRQQEAEERKLKDEEELKKILAESIALKEEYASEATVSLDRIVLEMETMEGTFFAEFLGDWNNSKGCMAKGKLFFLGEQKVVDGKVQVRIKKAPAWLTGDKFFTPANMEFAPYGELEGPFKAVMKALRTQARHRLEEVA